MRKRVLTMIAIGLAVIAAAAQSLNYENTRGKADRFFSHQEWASAAATYTLMLHEKPRVAQTYGRAIVSYEMLADTVRPIQLLDDAMNYGVPLDSVLANVKRFSFLAGKGSMYENFLLQARHANAWMARPLDAYLLDYYAFRRNGPEMVKYAQIMLDGAPDNVSFMLLKAEGYMIMGEADKAVAVWQKALDADPDSYTAILNLANYYDITGNGSLALDYFRLAQGLHPTPYVRDAIRRLEPHKK